jgi:hypothetical protein
MSRIRNTSCQCSGSGIRCFLTPGPGSGIGFFRIPDLGSRIPTPYFLELSDKLLGKKFYNSLKTGPNCFLQHLRIKFVATKKGLKTNFFSLLSFVALLFLDPGSEVRDPEWVKIRIRDKHPGSATLLLATNLCLHLVYIL